MVFEATVNITYLEDDVAEQKSEQNSASIGAASEKEKVEHREIKGGLPYSTSPGVLKKALESIISAERPDKFSTNYMATILRLTGGSARAVPPFFKKMQFVGPDGTPTALYSKFKTDGGRSQAAYEGLRNAFSEIFKRNEYAHKADEGTIKDIVVEITGLRKNDPIIRLIYSSFDAVRSFVSSDVGAPETNKENPNDEQRRPAPEDNTGGIMAGSIGLSYQINIVLPETENISVFNAIFKSLRENLLR